MKAFVFPGQGAQFVGMGKDLYENSPLAKELFEKANDIKVPYVIAPRRPGDIDTCYADSTKAADILGWKAEKTLEDMCRDTWNWQKNNPNGYDA